mmetsp:Transcript_85843/g.151500  ORF Transcript_85843/g.151500 Transcript_85843/m.151500 type:complete len:348 (-) Transcript_85843:36-1079(-)
MANSLAALTIVRCLFLQSDAHPSCSSGHAWTGRRRIRFTSCPDGYARDNGSSKRYAGCCNECPTTCSYDTPYWSCIDCPVCSGHGWDAANNSCKACAIGLASSDFYCAFCPNGYTCENEQVQTSCCESCELYVEGCIRCRKGICQECRYGHGLDGPGKCKPCASNVSTTGPYGSYACPRGLVPAPGVSRLKSGCCEVPRCMCLAHTEDASACRACTGCSWTGTDCVACPNDCQACSTRGECSQCSGAVWRDGQCDAETSAPVEAPPIATLRSPIATLSRLIGIPYSLICIILSLASLGLGTLVVRWLCRKRASMQARTLQEEVALQVESHLMSDYIEISDEANLFTC